MVTEDDITRIFEAGKREEVVTLFKDLLDETDPVIVEIAVTSLYSKISRIFQDDADEIISILDEIHKRFFSYENINEMIIRTLRKRSVGYVRFKGILKRIFAQDDGKIIQMALFQTRTYFEYRFDKGDISEDMINELFSWVTECFERVDEIWIKQGLISLLSIHPFEKLAEPYLFNLVQNSPHGEIWENAIKAYAVIVKREVKYIENFIRLLGPNKHEVIPNPDFILNTLEEIVTTHSDVKDGILVHIYAGFIRNREVIFNPKVKNLLMNIKFNSEVLKQAPIVSQIVRYVVTEKDMKKSRYGWFYERYLDYERQFLDILNYVPLKNSLRARNFQISSPKIVNLHVQLGTMIDSTFYTYTVIIKKVFPGILSLPKKVFFNRALPAFDDILNIGKMDVRLRDFPIHLSPFRYRRKGVDKRGNPIIERPKWYGIYSEHKHNLLGMENITNLEQLLRTLAAFYILVVYHPDNWNSIEFDWDSKIFDKYSVFPGFSDE